MNRKKYIALLLALEICLTFCSVVTTAQAAQASTITYDFESEAGLTPGVYGGWNGPWVKWTTEEYHSGQYSAKIIRGSNPTVPSFISFPVENTYEGAEYTLTLWYKGEITGGQRDGFAIKVEPYKGGRVSGEGSLGEMYSKTYYSAADWTKVEYIFTPPEETDFMAIYPRVYALSSTIYVDDITFSMTQPPPTATLYTDQVFYYTGVKTGYAKLELMRYYLGRGYTADISLSDGSSVLCANSFSSLETAVTMQYDISLLRDKKKEYTVKAIIKDSSGVVVDTLIQPVYRYDRPKAIREDGAYVKNGEKVNPVFMYHITESDWNIAAAGGINVVQYVCKSTPEATLADLDRLESLGMMAAVVCYWGMAPAGHESNYERVGAMVKAIKHHPAIFCWMVMDEPFINNPNAYEDLRKSYVMLRGIDDVHPLYICEGLVNRYEEAGKYADILSVDPYPGHWQDMGKWPGEMVAYAREKVSYNKPVYAILQAFTYGNTKPTAVQLHSMIYQSFLNGAQGIGYYTWIPDNTEADVVLNKGLYWPVLVKFYQEEAATVFGHFIDGTLPLFDSKKQGDVWYESWVDAGNVYLAVLNRTKNEQTVRVPLASQNRQVVINAYNTSVCGYAGYAGTVPYTAETGALTVTLAPQQPVLFKIVPETPVDLEKLSDMTVNGSFEVATNGVPDGWSFIGGAADTALVQNADATYDGTNYLQFTAADNGVQAVLKGEKGKVYQLEVYYKADIEKSAFINMEDSEKRSAVWEQGASYGTTNEVATEWKYTRMLMRAGRGCRSGDITITLKCDLANATVCYDMVKVICLEGYENRNMLLSGDFEYAGTRDTERTNITNWTASSGYVTAQTANVKQGTQSLRLRQRAESYSMAFVDSSAESPKNVANCTYRLSGWVKDNAVGVDGQVLPSARLLVYRCNSDGSFSSVGNASVITEGYPFDGSFVTFPLTEKDVWTYVSVDFTLPQEANIIRFGLFAGSKGQTWFDDFSIVPLQTCVDVMDGDGKILEEVPGAVDATLSARGRYTGTANSAKIYLAVYDKVSGDTAVLKHIAMAAVPNDGNYYTCKVENADTSGEGVYVKAFLWDVMKPVIDPVTLSRAVVR